MKLGFGLMRLPRIEGGEIDIEQVKRMVDMFIEAGGRYFDTAYVYEGSEEATRRALVERYPRSAYELATKLNARAAKDDPEAAKAQLKTSLERTGAGYFDYYLLHALGEGNVQLYDDFGLWDFVKELKEQGIIRQYGFSFHDSPELLDGLLTKHPDVDFVQLQINYADWNDPKIAARANYEVARKHGKPVVIMEPVKGGILSELPDDITKLFRSCAPEASTASWAIRFAASLDGVRVVLSGMSTVEQMEDNLSYMKDFVPLCEGERDAIRMAQEMLAASEQIPCTSCRYCVEGCPAKITIPRVFGIYNLLKRYGRRDLAERNYRALAQDSAPASACVGCGQCEEACPQHLPVRELLKRAAAELE